MNTRGMVIGLGLVTASAWFTFHIPFKKHSIEIPRRAFRRTDIRYVLMGCLYMVVFINCEAASIRLFMRTFRGIVPFRRFLSYACAEFYFSAITPSTASGQPMQLYYMTRDDFGFAQDSFTLLIVAAVHQMSVLLYEAAVVIVRSLFVVAQPGVVRWPLIFRILVSGICSCAILLTILNGLLAEWAGMYIIGFSARVGVIRNEEKAQRRMERLIVEYGRDGAYPREYPLVILRILLRPMVQLTALLLVPYSACLALGIGTGSGSFPTMQAILGLAVTTMPLPGSMGASEGGLMTLYGPLFGAGQTFSIMMLSGGIGFYGFLVISGLVIAYLQFRSRLRAVDEGKQQAIGISVDR